MPQRGYPWRTLAFALLAGAQQLGAQSRTSELRDLRNLGGDAWSVWTAPARTTRRDLLPAGAAVGAVALTALSDSAIAAWITRHQGGLLLRALAPVREGWAFPLGDLLSTAPYLPAVSVATYAAGRLSGNSDLSDAGLGCVTSHLGYLGYRKVASKAVGRTRPARTTHPFQVSFPGSRDWDRQSFTAGHAGNTFACSTFLSRRFSLGAAEPMLFVYSAAVSGGRMADGWHWASDTMAGAIMGYAVGAAVAHQQNYRIAKQRASAGARVTLPAAPVFRVSISF